MSAVVIPQANASRVALFQRILRNAAAAGQGDASKLLNAQDRAAMASPPTVSESATATVSGHQLTVVSNNALFAQYGGLPRAYATSYRRYQSVTYGTGSTPSGGNIQSDSSSNAYPGANASAFAIEFMTDSAAPEIWMLGSGSFTVLVNDQYVSKTPTAYGGGGSRFIKLAFSGRANRRIRIEGNQGSGFAGVNIGATERLWRPDESDLIRAVFVGDSITDGSGATVNSYGYAPVAGKLLGWRDIRQVSIGGTGYANAGTTWPFISHLSTDLALHSPDIVIFAGGVNDGAQSGVQAAVLACLQTTRAFTAAPILVLGSFAGSSGPSAAIVSVEQGISAAVSQFADPYCAYAPVSPTANDQASWIYGTGKSGSTAGNGNSDVYTSSDGTHPNDLGHDYLARVAAAAVVGQVKTWSS